MRQFHVLDAWNYLSTVTTLAEARRLSGETDGFDRDYYKIIRAAVESGSFRVSPLGAGWT